MTHSGRASSITALFPDSVPDMMSQLATTKPRPTISTRRWACRRLHDNIDIRYATPWPTKFSHLRHSTMFAKVARDLATPEEASGRPKRDSSDHAGK